MELSSAQIDNALIIGAFLLVLAVVFGVGLYRVWSWLRNERGTWEEGSASGEAAATLAEKAGQSGKCLLEFMLDNLGRLDAIKERWSPLWNELRSVREDCRTKANLISQMAEEAADLAEEVARSLEREWYKPLAEKVQDAVKEAETLLSRAGEEMRGPLESLVADLRNLRERFEKQVGQGGMINGEAAEGQAVARVHGGGGVLGPWRDACEKLRKLLGSQCPEDSLLARATSVPDDIAPALHNVARTLQLVEYLARSPDGGRENAEEGVAGELEPLRGTLAEVGFVAFKPAEGAPLRPIWHEVVEEVPVPHDRNANIVKECVAPGYEWFGHLLLSARVKA